MAAARAQDTMLTADEVCVFFTGPTKPMTHTSLYRGIRVGKFPKPIHISRNLSRWRLSDCQSALDALAAKPGK